MALDFDQWSGKLTKGKREFPLTPEIDKPAPWRLIDNLENKFKISLADTGAVKQISRGNP